MVDRYNSEDELETLKAAPRPVVGKNLEDITENATHNFQEQYPSHGETGLVHTSRRMADAFAGPVMNGPAISTSEDYRLESENAEAEFEFEVKDSSLTMRPSEEGLEIDTEGEHRTLCFRYQEGDNQFFNLWLDEVYKELSEDIEQYARDDDTRIFEFERTDINNL